ncbi:MAG: BamA/TamA family outer membrane protein [Bacteroidota bacterium]
MRHPISILLLVLGIVSLPQTSFSQEFVEKITNFFEFSINKKAVAQDSTLFPNKVVLAPVANYEPATSLGFGIGAKFLFKLKGSGPETRTSNLPASLVYTLNNQFIFFSGYTVFFNQEKYLLKGNLIFSKYPISYFGIGSRSEERGALEISYDQVLVEPLLLKKVAKDLFIGGGIRYNAIVNTRLNEAFGSLPEGTSLQDSLGSTSSGLELAITYDSRDNVLNAFKGNFLEFTHGFYGEVAGGTNRFMLSKLDFRQYIQLHPQKLNSLALQWYTRFSWGDTPPLELSALGGPELLRGFQEGRFRDKIAFFAQAEYRWQALERIGFVFFGGMGDVVNDLGDTQFSNMKYSVGAGFRLKIVKSENLNIRFDIAQGLGPNRDRNFYLGIAESF